MKLERIASLLEPLKNYLIKIGKGEIKDVSYEEAVYHEEIGSSNIIVIGLKVDWDDLPFDPNGFGDLYSIDKYLSHKYLPQIKLFMDMTGNKRIKGEFRIKSLGLYRP